MRRLKKCRCVRGWPDSKSASEFGSQKLTVTPKQGSLLKSVHAVLRRPLGIQWSLLDRQIREGGPQPLLTRFSDLRRANADYRQVFVAAQNFQTFIRDQGVVEKQYVKWTPFFGPPS